MFSSFYLNFFTASLKRQAIKMSTINENDVNKGCEDVNKRYAEKIVLCESIDPYTINMEDLPEVTHLDICNYFVTSLSAYSQEEMQAKKGLEGHKFFESGWVRKIVSKRIANNKCIVVGLVDHSQRINQTPLQPWVLCQLSGMILAAHCTCIAGLGEVCSHVAAVLYAVETMIRSRKNHSKADFLCQWNHPSSSSIDRFLPLADMSFAKTERVGQDTLQLTQFDKEEIFDWVKENKEKTNTAAPLTLLIPGVTSSNR